MFVCLFACFISDYWSDGHGWPNDPQTNEWMNEYKRCLRAGSKGDWGREGVGGGQRVWGRLSHEAMCVLCTALALSWQYVIKYVITLQLLWQ